MCLKYIQNTNFTALFDYFIAINDPEGRCFQADDDILIYKERYVQGEWIS